MTVEQLVPARGPVAVEDVIAEIVAGTPVHAPFSASVVAFVDEFSRRLGAHSLSRELPALQALAFWTRPAGVRTLRDRYEALARTDTIRQPRGVVLHLPPTNVDTIFMYSWLLSVLCGNRGIIRLSAQRGAAANAICEVLAELLADPAVSAAVPSLAVVSYGHELEITAALSAAADVRVIWGGDETVLRIREVPLPPRATELTFADRYSFTIIDAAAYLAAGEARQSRLADDFAGDAYLFDQAACSSPQLVVWRGSREDVSTAADTFYPDVAASARRRGYAADASIGTAQTLAAAELAIDHNVCGVHRFGRELLVVEIDAPRDVARDTVGGGFLLSLRVGDLGELAPVLLGADQTVTHFGFDEDELRAFATVAGLGGAIDRIVPVGQALAFDSVWDGYNLLSAFTREIRVTRDPLAR